MRLFPLSALALAGLLPLLAHAGRDGVPTPAYRANIEVYDRTRGQTLPVYMHDGRLYVAGEPGHQYELRLSNRSGERLLAVTSVDGVNVISGATAESQQTGYVLEPWAGMGIEGWRKNMDEVATFYFTRLSNSYAARTGRPNDVGVIGVAVFRELRPCCRQHSMEDRAHPAPEEPLAQAEGRQDQDAAATAPQRAREKLGTGHGHLEPSRAEYVDFRRASTAPEETIVIYYDSRKNLVAQGVIRERNHYAGHHRPNPFPNEFFVPDP
jgi:hypothetical protein